MTIGDMVATLRLDASKFDQGVVKGQSALSRLRGSVSSFAATLTGLFSVGGLGVITGESYKAVDSNAKLARSLGMSSGYLAGLQHAARLSGVEVNMLGEQLVKLTARGGNVMELARQMDTIRGPTERAKLAVSAFGEEGLKLLPIFDSGSAALQQMINEGQRLHGVSPMDERLVEAANDALTRMKAAFAGIGNTLAVATAPWVEVFANGIRQMVPSVDSLNNLLAFWGSLLRNSVPLIGGFVGAMFTITTVQKAIAVGQALVLSLAGPAGWATLAAGAGIAVAAYAGIDSALDSFTQAARESTAQVAAMPEEMNRLATGTQSLMQQVGGSTFDLTSKIADLHNELEMLQAPEGLREMVKQRQELSKLYAGAKTGEQISQVNEIRSLMNERRNLLSLQKESESLASRMKAKLDGLKSPFEQWKEDLQDVDKALSKGLISQSEADRLKADMAKHIPGAEEGAKVDRTPATGGAAVALKDSADAFRLINGAMSRANDSKAEYARKLEERQAKGIETVAKLMRQMLDKNQPAPKIEEVDFS